MINVHTIKLGKAKSNCYILSNKIGEALIVYAGDSANQIIDFILSNNFKPLHTTTHTAGHCCILIDNFFFTGDILFRGKLDKTINKNLVQQKYRDALKQILDLPCETIIYSGHGQNTSVEEELKSNQELKELFENECIY